MSSPADVGPGQELSGEASLAQICKWVKTEQMCKAKRKVATAESHPLKRKIQLAWGKPVVKHQD